MIGGTSGESEERIRQVFEAASTAAPSLLFIDALDVIAAKRDVRHDMIAVIVMSQSNICVVYTTWDGSTHHCSALRLH